MLLSGRRRNLFARMAIALTGGGKTRDRAALLRLAGNFRSSSHWRSCSIQLQKKHSAVGVVALPIGSLGAD
jgi:hypothetical protein